MKQQDTLHKLDKKHMVVTSPDAHSDEIEYWFGKSPAERLAAMEMMRQIVYNYDPKTTRLQRVLTIIDHG